MISIQTSDLLYINDAAKALKQRSVAWYRDGLFGADLTTYITYIKLDVNRLSLYPNRAIQFIQKDLSKFTKAISTENVFNVEDRLLNNTTILNTLNMVPMNVHVTAGTTNATKIAYDMVLETDRKMLNISEENITDPLSDFYGLKKSAGIFKYIHDPNHLMYIFSSILPLNKSDKIFITMADSDHNTFISRFRIAKKGFNTYIYLRYLKV